MANAPEPSAGSQTVSSRICSRRGALVVLVEQLLERLGDDEPGQHLGRVVRRRLLALAAGEPEDEGALRGGRTGIALAGRLVLDVVTKSVSARWSARVDRDHPEPFAGSPSLATSYRSSSAKKPV